MKRIIIASWIAPLAFGAVACDRNPVSPDLSLPADFIVSNPELVAAGLNSARGAASISLPDQPGGLSQAAPVVLRKP